MEPKNFRFGGGATETVLGPFVLAGMLLAIVLILCLPRKRVTVPLLMGLLLCPAGETLVVGGLHFFVTRILILVGWIRLAISKPTRAPLLAGGYSTLDKVFMGWATYRALASVLVFLQMGALINQFGFLWDVMGGYFLLRALIRDDNDIHRALKTFACIAAILSVTMLYERFTGLNVYGVIGGVPIIPEIRNGAVRAQGPFEHALLAGSFAATLLPLFFWLWKSGRSRAFGIAGMMASSIIPFTTACSTPIFAYAGAVFGLCFWPLRRQMRLVRWGIVGLLVCLQLVMKVPFWWAIQHVNVVGGSSGWHRAQIIDLFIKHFADWFLIGTKSSASWGHMTWDAANQFVAEGTAGGLATLVFFIAMICIGFGKLGAARKSVSGNRKKEWFFWVLGVTLFADIVAFFGISYFDQTKYCWFALLAMIYAASAPVLAVKAMRRQPAGMALAESHPAPSPALFESSVASDYQAAATRSAFKC